MEAVKDQTFTGESLAAQLGDNTTQIGVTEGPVDSAQIDDATLLANLEEKLEKGKFIVRGLSPKSVRYLNTFVKDKAKYSGAQEAYYLLLVSMDVLNLTLIDNALSLKKEEEVIVKDYELRAFTIKVLNYFLSKAEGIGQKSAETFITYAQPINNALVDIQAVENQIKALRTKLGIDPPPAPTAAA